MEERATRPSTGRWYVPRLRDNGPSSAGPVAADVPAWRGLPSSIRSISAQLGGPLNQPTIASYRTNIRLRIVVKRIFNFKTRS
jgi:hypothetical protein